MSRKFKIRDQEAVHFVTFTTIHWLDPPVVGQAIFSRVEYRDIFLDSIRYCQKNKDWKFMRNRLFENASLPNSW